MMNIVMWVCGVMLGLATVACLIRVAKGPSILDRVLALDVRDCAALAVAQPPVKAFSQSW